MYFWNRIGKTLCLATAAVALIGASANADGSKRRHLIEIGTGLESALTDGGVNLLLRVGYGYSQRPQDGAPGDLVGMEQLVWAHISGDLAFDVHASGAAALPYLNLKFIPVHNQIAVVNEDGNVLMGDIQVLPIKIRRDIRLDQSVSVTSSLVGIQVGAAWPQNEKLAYFVQVAVDALAYKFVHHVSSQPNFHGFHFLGLEAEGGVSYKFNENFKVSIALGGSADVNFGTLSVGGPFSVQSDMEAYAALKLDIMKFMQLFLKFGYRGDCTSGGPGCEGTPSLLFGATFFF